jgi:hypothetical protein
VPEVQAVGPPVDRYVVTELIETRWRRYGKDRVYVKTVDGIDLGHVDLVARSVVSTVPAFEVELKDCLRWWTDMTDAVAPVVTATELSTMHASAVGAPADRNVEAPVLDLAVNVAGAAVRAKRNEVNAHAPVKNFVARVLGVKTDERAWRVGAKGEEKVAGELAKLGPGWRVLHAVEVGENGSDIDHVVIGPAGVITLNAKRHPGAKAWVGENVVMVKGQRTDYLRNARYEAKRASKLLTAACGIEVAVFAVVDAFTVKQMPADVHVTTRRRLVGWLQSIPASLDSEAVGTIYSTARLSSTWR